MVAVVVVVASFMFAFLGDAIGHHLLPSYPILRDLNNFFEREMVGDIHKQIPRAAQPVLLQCDTV